MKPSHDIPGSGSVRGAFTMIEMLVVLVVVLVLVVLVVPATTSLWNERKVSDARNSLQGLLLNARARSIQAGGRETGLFFFLDPFDVQRIAVIEQYDPSDVALQDVFHITGERDFSLPPPRRVVPRYVVDEDQAESTDNWRTFSDEELSWEDVSDSPPDGNTAQRHRNFFTLVFGGDGRPLVWRDVLIRDVDLDSDGTGDRTGLPIGSEREPEAPVLRYASLRGMPRELPLMPPRTSAVRTDGNLLTTDRSSNPTAHNFPSVDGVLLYDEAAFRSWNMDLRRELLLRTSRPFYLHPLTGGVILGPVGEGEPDSNS